MELAGVEVEVPQNYALRKQKMLDGKKVVVPLSKRVGLLLPCTKLVTNAQSKLLSFHHDISKCLVPHKEECFAHGVCQRNRVDHLPDKCPSGLHVCQQLLHLPSVQGNDDMPWVCQVVGVGLPQSTHLSKHQCHMKLPVFLVLCVIS